MHASSVLLKDASQSDLNCSTDELETLHVDKTNILCIPWQN